MRSHFQYSVSARKVRTTEVRAVLTGIPGWSLVCAGLTGWQGFSVWMMSEAGVQKFPGGDCSFFTL